MNRRSFIVNSTLATFTLMDLKSFANSMAAMPEVDVPMPVLFAGHGNPMNAIEENEFTRGWKLAASVLPQPKAILCISAHWETKGTLVTAMKKPQTIHDFGGFPQKLFDVNYPVPGSPELAKEIISNVKKTIVLPDEKWGLDHGTWSVLLPMYPKADIPVLQLSIDYTQSPQYHYDLAKELSFLRKKGVLILGSGNIVHNLGMFTMKDTAFDWALEFDAAVKKSIDSGDHNSLINYQKFGKAAQLSVPTNEHYLPLLYIAALKNENEKITYFNEKTTAGSISMRSVVFHS